MPTSRRPERLVVDANPILAALLGGAARRVFFESDVREFAVPEKVIEEVRAHIPALARKLGLKAAFLDYSLDLLPLTHYIRQSYRQNIPEARRLIEHRDPDDVDVLALTLTRIIQCAVKRRCVSHRCKSCLGSRRDAPVATKTIRRATDWSKLLGQRPTVGGSASRRAATRVKPEQASKVTSRGPTGLNNREGRWSLGEHPTDEPGLPRRGKGRGTPAQHTGQHGRSRAARRREPRSTFGVEPRGKSEGLIVPQTPAGQPNRWGGKEPWFEVCLDERRIRRWA
ncbi:MAG: hypothetical protein HZA60_04995 [Deltaproteobacteria bacterium]|nr:hypothetical protein [Deltaproteobacteria bacterium]